MPVMPALWEAKAGGSLDVRHLRPAWPTWWNPVSSKNTKLIQAWWHMLLAPATQEAEAGNHLNLGGKGCSEPRSCHCTPAWVTEWDSISKNKKYIHTHIHTYVCVYSHTYTYTYMCVCMYMHVCVLYIYIKNVCVLTFRAIHKMSYPTSTWVSHKDSHLV